ncbi:MAG: hypothetical protein ACYTXT_06445 [Nostoc sp.]
MSVCLLTPLKIQPIHQQVELFRSLDLRSKKRRRLASPIFGSFFQVWIRLVDESRGNAIPKKQGLVMFSSWWLRQ